MANQDDQQGDKSEMRIMWIGSGVIAALILGLMGYNMIFHHDLAPDSSELSSQSRTASPPSQ